MPGRRAVAEERAERLRRLIEVCKVGETAERPFDLRICRSRRDRLVLEKREIRVVLRIRLRATVGELLMAMRRVELVRRWTPSSLLLRCFGCKLVRPVRSCGRWRGGGRKDGKKQQRGNRKVRHGIVLFLPL